VTEQERAWGGPLWPAADLITPTAVRVAATHPASTASLGTEEASTPSEIQSVRRPPAATTPLCVTTSDHAGPRPLRADTRSN
jgi:hypothetical protein